MRDKLQARRRIEEEELIVRALLAVCQKVYKDWNPDIDRLSAMRPQGEQSDELVLVINRPLVDELVASMNEALPGYQFALHPAGKGECALVVCTWFWQISLALEQERITHKVEANQKAIRQPLVSPWREWVADGLIIAGAWFITALERWAVRLNPALMGTGLDAVTDAMDDPENFRVDVDDDDLPPAMGNVAWK